MYATQNKVPLLSYTGVQQAPAPTIGIAQAPAPALPSLAAAQTTGMDLSSLINMIVPIIGLSLMISIIKPMMKGFGAG